MGALAGAIADPGAYNADILKLLRWGMRDTASSTTTTEVGVLRIDGIPTKAGHLYAALVASSLIFGSTVADDLMEARLRYNATDTADTSSTQFGVRAERSRSASGSQYTDGITAFLPSPGDGEMSVLLSIARTGGTGSVSIPASASYPVALVILDLGTDTGNVGVPV